MGGVGDFLFGSTEDPSVQSASLLTGGQDALLDELTRLTRGQVGKGVESYPGSLTALPSGLEKQSWDLIEQLLGGGIQGRSATSQDAINRILGGTGEVPKYDVGKFDTGAIQDWYQNALVGPSLRTWEQDIVPAIQEKFISQNAGSSGGANRAIARSGEDLATNLNAQLANVLFGEKQAFDTREFEAGTGNVSREFAAGQNDLNRILNVPGLQSQELKDFMSAIGLGTGAGATQRGIEQQGLNEAFQKWSTEQGYNNPWLTNFLNTILGTGAVENVVNPGSQQSGFFQDVIAPAGAAFLGTETGAGAAAALLPLLGLSSKRYKKNIKLIGNKIHGLQPIEFEYTKEALKKHTNMTAKGVHTGFLAEDVAEKYPDAVIYDSIGRPDAINYMKLFSLMEV